MAKKDTGIVRAKTAVDRQLRALLHKRIWDDSPGAYNAAVEARGVALRIALDPMQKSSIQLLAARVVGALAALTLDRTVPAAQRVQVTSGMLTGNGGDADAGFDVEEIYTLAVEGLIARQRNEGNGNNAH